MGGGGGSDKTTSTVRYAPYIEDHHAMFLNIMANKRDIALDNNPFTDYEDVDIDSAFFGVGYGLTSYPALYDMFGKFMGGLDVDYLFNQSFADSTNNQLIDNLVSAEAALIDDETTQIITKYKAGMRDINSVISSSYLIGESLIRDGQVKSLAKFSSELRYRMIAVAAERWSKHLEWNKSVISVYAELLKLYAAAKMDIDDHNYSFKAKRALWPFTVLDYDRAAIGALQGAVTRSEDVAGASKTQKALAGALSGAAIGAAAGAGVPGAIVGGLIGLAAGLFG